MRPWQRLGEPIRNELAPEEFDELLSTAGWRRVAAPALDEAAADAGIVDAGSGLVAAAPVAAPA